MMPMEFWKTFKSALTALSNFIAFIEVTQKQRSYINQVYTTINIHTVTHTHTLIYFYFSRSGRLETVGNASSKKQKKGES